MWSPVSCQRPGRVGGGEDALERDSASSATSRTCSAGPSNWQRTTSSSRSRIEPRYRTSCDPGRVRRSHGRYVGRAWRARHRRRRASSTRRRSSPVSPSMAIDGTARVAAERGSSLRNRARLLWRVPGRVARARDAELLVARPGSPPPSCATRRRAPEISGLERPAGGELRDPPLGRRQRVGRRRVASRRSSAAVVLAHVTSPIRSNCERLVERRAGLALLLQPAQDSALHQERACALEWHREHRVPATAAAAASPAAVRSPSAAATSARQRAFVARAHGRGNTAARSSSAPASPAHVRRLRVR